MYFNRRHRRSGHLFGGRYRGHLIESEGYYLEVSRYIHLNPVRARRVSRPQEWPWGSCPGYARASRTVDWIIYDAVLGEFGRSASQARRAYARFLQAGMDRRPRSPFGDALGGLIVGSDAFVARVRRMLSEQPDDLEAPQRRRIRHRPPLEEIIAVVAEECGVASEAWLPGRRSNDVGRALAAYLARRVFGYPATEIAAGLSYRDHSGVGRAVRRVEEAPDELRGRVARLRKTLLNP